MTGFNLPDGCETHHIPGNRPEDIVWEQAWEELDMDDICAQHFEECDHARYTSPLTGGIHKYKCVACAKDVRPNGDPTDCPFAERHAEAAYDDMMERRR